MTDFGVTFEEEQGFSPVLSALVYGALIVAGAGAYFATREAGEGAAALIALAPAFIIVTVLFALKMKTTVNESGVRIRTLHFIDRRIPFSEIAEANAVQYRPLLDYGGWGYRLSGKGKAYNMQGDRGVQLHLKNGGRVLIGSQQEQALELAIKAGLR